jgi:tetratricopeptide (TPR) repeat protein
MIAILKQHRRLPLRAVAAAATLLLASCGLWMDSEDTLARAQKSRAEGDLRAALVDLRTLLRKDPQMLEARVALGEVSLEMGDVASATRELELARNGSLPLERVAPPLARAYLAGQRTEDALALLDSVPTVSSDASLLALRGTALLALNRGAEAKQAFETAVRVDPKSADALLGLASAISIDDMTAALALTDRALALEPDAPRVRLARGALQMQGDHFAEAEKEFRAAAEQAKKQANSSYVLAALAGLTESLLARNESGGALEVSAQLLDMAPQNSLIRYLRARALFQGGKPDEARPLLEQNLSDNAQDANSRLLLGAVKLALGDLGQARRIMSPHAACSRKPGCARASPKMRSTRSRPCSTRPTPAKSCSRSRDARAWPRARLLRVFSICNAARSCSPPTPARSSIWLLATSQRASSTKRGHCSTPCRAAASHRCGVRSCRSSRNWARATCRERSKLLAARLLLHRRIRPRKLLQGRSSRRPGNSPRPRSICSGWLR